MANLKPTPSIPLLRPKSQLITHQLWINPVKEIRRRASLWAVNCVDGHLVREFGWGVRRMVQIDDEMRGVAQVQAEAFHVPVALFNDFFFKFFKAEVLSALIYRIQNSAPDRYACLVAEFVNANSSSHASVQGLVGVVDYTVQRDRDILRHLEGAEEYLYVSGIAVLTDFRRSQLFCLKPAMSCQFYGASATLLFKHMKMIRQLRSCTQMSCQSQKTFCRISKIFIPNDSPI